MALRRAGDMRRLQCDLVHDYQPGETMKRLLTLSVAMLAASALSAAAADAKETYEKDCAKCHGTDGKGDTKMGKKLGAKDYTDAKVQAELKDEAAVKAIKEGLKDKEGKQLMKPTEGISDADAKALVGYMRKFKK
jgi:mono/diheme cytochrome c family protein